MANVFYKIKLKDSNRYLKGTPSYHNYDLRGRLFVLKELRTFLTIVMKGHRRNRLSDWEIVECVLEQTAVKQIHEVITEEKLMEMLKT